MITYTCKRHKKLCSSNYIIRSYFKYPTSDLRNGLLDHKRNNTTFSAFDLHKIKHDILEGLAVLHAAGLSHGDVRPDTIGYDSLTDNYILIDKFKHGLPFEKCQTDHLVNNRELFMSPGLYSRL